VSDDFPARLRTLVDQAVPPTPIDPDTALDVARRRTRRTRGRRAAASMTAAAAIVTGLVTVPGLVTDGSPLMAAAPGAVELAPSTPTAIPEPAEAPTPEPPRAIVDEAAGTITTPIDEWSLSPQEHAEMDTAREVFIARCMSSAGYGDLVEVVGPVPAKDQEGLEYGLWRHALLTTTGYTQEFAESPNRIRTRPEDEAAIEQNRSCVAQAIEAGVSYEPGQFEEIAPTGITPATYTPEGIAVIDEWKQCLSQRGVEPPGENEGMVPPAVWDASPEEIVRIGEIDLACKDDLDTVQRLADIQAAQEAEYIARAKDYLEQRSAVEQAALEASRAYLADQGLSMDPATW
jgi:hypothetical protein